MRRGKTRLGEAQTGFTYLWLLAGLAVLSIGMAAAGPLWAQQTQRDREAELLRVGRAYAVAIEHYYRSQPGGIHELPRSVDDLLQDGRFTTPTRHLRAAYSDPMQPGKPLTLLFSAAGGIRGVASDSADRPIRQSAPPDSRLTLPTNMLAEHYRDWQFLASLSS